ncbi:MAG: hypothetical protein HGA44_03305, partial [Cellulomonadaceae bacterium]|nr:hypothetical protein [Cellulomonadaceae bacterium]
MTQSSGADAAATHGPGRRWWWVGAAAAVVVAVVVISVSVAGGDEPDAQSTSPGVSASPTSSSTTSASAEPSDAASSTSSSAPSSSPSASAPAGQSSAVGAATLPPLGDTPPQVVPLDGTGESAGAVTATVVGIEMVESTASGIGEVAGPAIRVRLGVTNATGA